jgi:MscS family membrane protein
MTAKQLRTLALIALFWIALPASGAAQIPGLPSVPSSPPAEEQPVDPLGRTTPRGTLAAFIRAVDRQDFVSAERYMQISAAKVQNTETLARNLKTLLDHYFNVPLTRISDAPQGTLEDGLPLDQESVGHLTIGDRKIDVTLVRLTDAETGPIWQISSETMAQVPMLSVFAPRTLIERVMPEWLLSRNLAGFSLANWVALVASFVIPFLLLALIAGAFLFLARRFLKDSSRRGLDLWYDGIHWPVICALTIVFQRTAMSRWGFDLGFRFGYTAVSQVLTVIAFTWLIRRILTLGFERARNLAWGPSRRNTQSLLLLGERLVKALVAVVAVFVVLVIVGVDAKTALAGLGIGGVALALGAQKTVENLLGGIFLLTDRVIAVGDQCRIANRMGRVEDITLRSVRLRTPEQSLVSVPAGVLAQAGIENFATRKKFLIQTTLPLRYGTNAEQIRRILEGIRALLDGNRMIETETKRVRLVNFGGQAIELDLMAYVLTDNESEFMAVREDLLLAVTTIVESAGTGFAQPAQVLLTNGKPGAPVQVTSAPGPERRQPV